MADGSRSSPATVAHPLWTRLLIPSMGDTIFIALLAVLTCTSLSGRLLGDAGIGWHIRTGQQILASHAVPRVDSFSSTMRGKPWFAWEWLYDVIVGELDRWAGLNGVVWFTAVGDRRRVCVDVPAAPAPRDECDCGPGVAVTGRFVVDDSFSGAAACVELAVHAGMALDSGFVGIRLCLRRPCRTLRNTFRSHRPATPVASALADAGLGQCARWLSGRLCVAGDLLPERGLVRGQAEGRQIRRVSGQATVAGAGQKACCRWLCGRRGVSGKSLRMEAARTHLRLPVEPLSDGAH